MLITCQKAYLLALLGVFASLASFLGAINFRSKLAESVSRLSEDGLRLIFLISLLFLSGIWARKEGGQTGVALLSSLEGFDASEPFSQSIWGANAFAATSRLVFLTASEATSSKGDSVSICSVLRGLTGLLGRCGNFRLSFSGSFVFAF